MNIIHATKNIFALALAWNLSVAPATAQPATGTMVPVASTSPAPATSKPAGKLSGADEFSTASAAAAHCPNSVVVWSSLSKSHNFHLSSSRWFGKTKHGAYVCQSDALAAGFHQAKS